MPPNDGTRPTCERIDIKFRNGVVKRGEDPAKWNFAPLVHNGEPIQSPYDIMHWQEVK